MRIFLDANILVSVLNKEYPLYTHSARILSLADQRGFTVYTSPVCLAIAFYFAEKKSGVVQAKKKISTLAQHIMISDTGKEVVENAAKDVRVHNFEDGLEYYSAKKSKCEVLITEDLNDFYFSAIEILNAKQFMEKYLAQVKKITQR